MINSKITKVANQQSSEDKLFKELESINWKLWEMMKMMKEYMEQTPEPKKTSSRKTAE